MAINLKPTITKTSTATKRLLLKVQPLLEQIRPTIVTHYRRLKRNPRLYILTHRRQTLIAIPVLLVFLFVLINSSLTFLSNLPPQAPPFTTPLISDYYVHAENQIFSAQLGHKDTQSPAINFTVNDQDITFSLKDASPTKPKKKGRSLVFENVADNLSISYQTLPNGIKEELILTQLPTTNTFSFTLDYSNLKSPKVLNNINAPVFYDQEGNYLFHFEKPFAYDSAGNRTDDATLIINIDPETNKYIAQLSVSSTWLSSPDRVYPVYIDPTIVHDTSSEFSGAMNRVHDAGSGSTPIIENFTFDPPLDNNNLSYWRLDETSNGTCSGGTDVCDSSTNGITGTVNGTSITTTDQWLGTAARYFDGTDDYVTFGDVAQMDAPSIFTISAWFYRDSDTNTATVHAVENVIIAQASKAANDNIELGTDGTQIDLYLDTASATTNQSFEAGIQDDTWYHIALVYDSSSTTEVLIYLNGELVASSTTWGGALTSSATSPLSLGISRAGSSNVGDFNGYIDNVSISTTARTPEEIRGEAGRFLSSVYTSPIIDLTNATSFNSFSWSGSGIPTGDGETASSSSGLVAQWNFNETSGTTASVATGSCGSTCNGTLTSFSNTTGQDVIATSGWSVIFSRWDGGLNFDGTDDYVVVSDNNNLDITSALTIEAWIRPSDSSVARTIVGKRDSGVSTIEANYAFRIDNNNANQLEFYYSYSGSWNIYTTTNANIQPGEWAHVVVTHDGSSPKIYKNGRLLAGSCTTGTCNHTLTADDNSFAIGRPGDRNDEYFKGAIDAVRIYSRVLSANEILSNYNHTQIQFQTRTSTDSATWEDWKTTSNDTQIYSFDDTTLFNPSESGLIGYWPLDETSDNTCSGGEDACDATANSNDGSIIGTNYIADGVFGKSRRFSGTSVNVGNVSPLSSLEYNSNMTFSVWIKSGTDHNGTILSKQESSGNYRGYNLQTGSGGYIYFQLVNTYSSNTLEVRSTSNLNYYDNQWHLVTATYDGSATPAGIKIYFDGIQVATTTTINSLSATIANASSFHIGSRNGAAQFFNGLIDEVRVFNSVLDSETIKNQYVLGSTNHLSLHPALDAILKNEGDASLNLTTGKLKVDTGTVAYYTLDETGGSGAYIKDLSPNYNHGTPTGTSPTNGVSNKARSFNGTSDYILIPDSSTFNVSNLTIEAWVYSADFSHQGLIFEKTIGGTANTQYSCFFNPSNTFYFRTYNTSNTVHDLTFNSANYFIPNQWNHVACVYNGATKQVYVNGALAASTAYTQTLQTGSGTSIIGAYGSGTAYFFNGKIDELRVSNIARTPTEIAESYRLGRNHQYNIIPSSYINLFDLDHLPVSIAADEPGTYLQTILSQNSYIGYQPDENTVGLYHLEEKSPSSTYLVQDSSVYKNHGTPNSITLDQGVIGNGAKFTGPPARINLGNPSSLQITGNQTIEMWIYPTGFALRRNPFCKAYGGEGCITQETNGTLNYYYGTAGGNTTPYQAINSSAALELKKWTHIAIVRDLDNMTLTWYFNGAVVNTAAASYASATASGLTAYIGYGYTNYFTGSLDELRISNVARNADSIRQSYEAGRRTHSITVDFGASLDSGNLISDSSDTSFTIDATTKGLSQKGSNLYVGDTIIIKENYDGTEYIAQGEVASVNASTGAVTVSSWNAGSTFPTSGFTIHATVFKWQTEYINLSKIRNWDRNVIFNIGLKITDGNQGRSVWIDDLRKSGGYYTNNLNTTIASTPHRYFQYRSILTTADALVTPALHSVTLDYVPNYTPNQTNLEAAYLHDNLYTPDTTPTIRFSATDDDNDDLNYQVQIYTDADFSSPTSYISDADSGFDNITTPADTAPFNDSDTISFTFPTLSNSTTYFYRVRAIDPSGSNDYGDWSITKSFTVNTSLTNNAWHQTHADQFSTDTTSLFINISDAGNYVTIDEPLIYRTVTINNSGSEQTDYDALIELDTASLILAGKMQSDCDDIRFWTDDTLTTNLDYYLESGCNTSTTQIWVKIPTLANGNNVIYLSYNDATASSGSQTWSTTSIIGAFTSSCPNGWTSVSAINDSNRFIRGNTSYGSTGGNTTHTHSISGTAYYHGATQNGQNVTSSQAASSNHGHSYNFITSGPTEYQPPYKDVIYCSYDTTATIPDSVPTSFIGFFSSTPTGWTIDSGFNTRFPRGNTSAGSTGGSETHTHTFGGTLGAANAWVYNEAGVDIRPSTTHTHSVSTTSTDTGSHVPPYYTLNFSNPDSTTYLPKGIISIFNGATLPPLGWTRFSSLDQFFPRADNTSATTGGSTTHSHDYFAESGQRNANLTATGDSGITVAGKTHTHRLFGTSSGRAHLPPYIDVVFAQKNNDTTTKTLGDEVTQPYLISTKITGAQIYDANWHQLTFNDDETNGTITYQILYDNSGTPTPISDDVLSGNSTGFTTSPVDLSSISKTTYPELYVKANFTYSGGAPILYDWTVTANDPPNVPTLDSPAHQSTRIEIAPTLKTTANDPESDYVRYKIEMCTDLSMTQNCQTFDQTSSQTGWSGQDAESNTAYASGTQASYTIQTPLSHNQTYFWRSYAIDPGGSNIWSDTQTQPIRFTTIHVVPPSECTAEVAPDFSSIIIHWVDNTLNEDSFELEKKINSGAFTNIQTTLPDVTSYQDSTVSATNAYQYRVRSVINSDPSVWCNTAVLDLGTGSFQFEGLQLEGLQLH